MRHLSLLSLAAFLILIVSCSKEKPKSYEELIVGKWNLINVEYKDKSTGVTQTEPFSSPSSIEFSANGTYQVKLDDNDNGSLDPDEVESGTYDIDNSTLTFFGLGYSETYNIKTLTSSSCIIFQENVDYIETINLRR